MQNTVAAFFREQHPRGVQAAILFGSHARGTSHADSDIDVGLLLDRRLLATRAERAAIAERVMLDLIAATHCNDVDVVVLNDALAELAVAVLDTGALMRCADQEALHAFTRDAHLRFADLQPFLDRTRRLKLDAILR